MKMETDRFGSTYRRGQTPDSSTYSNTSGNVKSYSTDHLYADDNRTQSIYMEMTSHKNNYTNGSDASNSLTDICEQLGLVEMTGSFLEMNGCRVEANECPGDMDEFVTNRSGLNSQELLTDTAKVKFNNINIYNQDKDGDTLLHCSIIMQATVYAIRCINMAQSSTQLSLKNALFQTSLHLAVLTNQITVVRRLVVGGSDIEARDKDGNTALHIACRKGFLNIVHVLLKPVTCAETNENNYKIRFQRIPQNLEIMNYEGQNCLHIAASNRHLDIVEILIDKGADINAKEIKTGRTILHNACISGDVDLVQLLLRSTCININALTYDEYTPFDFARLQCHSVIIRQLATAGARSEDEDIERI